MPRFSLRLAFFAVLCVCLPGVRAWAACPNNCSGHGFCDGFNCQCDFGWAGNACQYSDATTCLGHGMVHPDGTCTCFSGYAGSNCQFSDAITCNGHGTVNNAGQCTCNVGWIGPNCATPVPLVITAWRSVRTHTGPGNVSITLNASAAGNDVTGPTVETRQGGIQRIEVDFNLPIMLLNPNGIMVTGWTTVGGVMGSPAGYTPSSVSVIGTTTMRISFDSGLPDQACFNIMIGPGTLAGGLAGDTDANVRSLFGDTTMSGVVNLSDVIWTRTNNGQSVSSFPQFDIDTSGVTNLSDAFLIKTTLISSPPRQALCP